MNVQVKASLIASKIEILKLKSDNYTWYSYLTEEERADLEATLAEINNELAVRPLTKPVPAQPTPVNKRPTEGHGAGKMSLSAEQDAEDEWDEFGQLR